jgi:nucleotide-binding universal stress UspA family protein
MARGRLCMHGTPPLSGVRRCRSCGFAASPLGWLLALTACDTGPPRREPAEAKVPVDVQESVICDSVAGGRNLADGSWPSPHPRRGVRQVRGLRRLAWRAITGETSRAAGPWVGWRPSARVEIVSTSGGGAMAGAAGEILVGYDGSAGSEQALSWAAREAQSRGAVLAICHACVPGEADGSDGALRGGERTIASGLRSVRGIMRSGKVRPLLVAGPAAEVLCERSRSAGMVVVVRGHWRPAAGYLPGPVVVGVDGSAASRPALAFAFDEAALRGAPLQAVCAGSLTPGHARRCWPPRRMPRCWLSVLAAGAGWGIWCSAPSARQCSITRTAQWVSCTRADRHAALQTGAASPEGAGPARWSTVGAVAAGRARYGFARYAASGKAPCLA